MRKDRHSSEGQQAQSDERIFALLAEMGAQLSGYTESAGLERAVVEGAARILNCDSGALIPWDETTGLPRRGPMLGRGQLFHDCDLLGNRQVRSHVIGKHGAMFFGNPGQEIGSALGEFSALAASPLVAEGRLVAVLVLASASDGRTFTSADQALLRVVSNFSAAVLESTGQLDRFSHDLRARIVEATRELSRAQAELARVKGFNESIFQSIALGIIVFDRSFAVVFRNRLAERCFPEERNVLQSLAKTSVKTRYADYEDICRDVIRLGQVCGFDAVRYAREGGELVLNVWCAPLLTGQEAIVGGIMTVEDVTRRVDMERRLEASERLAAVGKLASKVAHELNNPLDGILRYINLALRVSEGQGDQRPAAYLKEARTGLMRMVRIIGELLEFSRSTVQSSGEGDIRAALDDALKSLSGLAERQRVALKLDVADDVPPLQSASLYQVFTNLIKNAIEALPGGGRVDVRALVAAGAVEVIVADSGPGIPEDKLTQIFEPFYSTKGAGQGTGLGLAISKEIVEKHGGTLVARNRAAGGAEFVVRIPTQWARQGKAAGGTAAQHP